MTSGNPFDGHGEGYNYSDPNAPNFRFVPKLPVRHASELAEPILSNSWIIRDVLPTTGIGALYGPPGSMKTFNALHMASVIAGSEETYGGRQVEHGAVLYFILEGGRGFHNRVAAIAKTKGVPEHLYICDLPLSIRQSLHVKAMQHAVTGVDVKATEGYTKRESRVRLIVIDTLARANSGADENSPEAMTAAIAAAEELRRDHACFLLVVHHTGKDAAAGLRGHSSLLGALDTAIEIGDDVLTVRKQRDGEDGVRIGFESRVIELGTDQYGLPVTSRVIDIVEPPSQSEAGNRATIAKALSSGNLGRVLEALQIFIADNGVPTPTGTGWPEPGRFKCVDASAAKEFAIGRDPDQEDRAKAERRVRDAMRKLDKHGLTATNDGKLWIVRHEP